MRRWLSIVGIVVLLFFSFASSGEAAAQDRTLAWKTWDTTIRINEDGSFNVREVYEIEFIGGPFTFGFRNISLDQVESIVDVQVSEQGRNYTAATTEAAQTFYTNRADGDLVVNWFYAPTSNQTRTFVVEYRVLGGLIVDAEGDILNWQAVGEEHAYSIQSSDVVVVVPAGAQIVVEDPPASRGVSASQNISNDVMSVSFNTSNIPANTPLEVYVRFTHGVIPATAPSWQAEYERQAEWDTTWGPVANLASGALALAVLVFGVLGVYLLWGRLGRDPKTGPVPSYLSVPPSDLSPGIVGALVDEKVDLQDIMAVLMDLATRGYVQMEEQEVKGFIRKTSTFTFHRVEGSGEPERDYEQDLLRAVFGRKQSVDLDDLQYKFYDEIPKLKRAIYNALVTEGLFPRNPNAVRSRWMVLGIGGVVLSFGGGFCSLAAVGSYAPAIICLFVASGVVSLTLIAVGQAMPVKSQRGAEEAAKWKAFKAYLTKIENLENMEEAGDIFNRYLPYAVAFGIEKLWIRTFAKYPATPIPHWYFPYWATSAHRSTLGKPVAGRPTMRDLSAEQVTPGANLDSLSGGLAGGLERMSDGLTSMLDSTARTLTSVPQSSSSSGGFGGSTFSSGGFSGGGFSSGGSGGAGFG